MRHLKGLGCLLSFSCLLPLFSRCISRWLFKALNLYLVWPLAWRKANLFWGWTSRPFHGALLSVVLSKFVFGCSFWGLKRSSLSWDCNKLKGEWDRPGECSVIVRLLCYTCTECSFWKIFLAFESCCQATWLRRNYLWTLAVLGLSLTSAVC